MAKNPRNKALVQAWFIWAIAAALMLDNVTGLSPGELFCKALFAVISVSAVRESWSWIKFRRTQTDLPADA
ncbi:hypothetical protein [Streptomyces sp. NPDC085540]|uniref:hypothetical protein n=1 Tax=Streptomyces sp. NPDC085540 TaxID=3365730 RepID=UPI0037D7A918